MASPTEPRTPRLYHAASGSAFTALGGILVLFAAMASLLLATTVTALAGAAPLLALGCGELALVVVPVVAALRTGRGAGALGLRRTAPLYVLAAVLIGMSLWYLNWRLVQQLELPEHKIEWLERLSQDAGALGPMLLVLGVLPALCEEIVFRGVLVQALATRLVPVAAVAVGAVLFAGYHMSLAQLIPTFTLGLVCGTIALRARSVYPTMIAHFLNNAFALLVDRLPWIPAHPRLSIAAATVLCASGVALVFVPAPPAALPSPHARYGSQL